PGSYPSAVADSEPAPEKLELSGRFPLTHATVADAAMTSSRGIGMKAEQLVEYGMPIDSQAMVTPADVTELELEAGHPGLGDEGYIRRRKELFALCRKHRLERLGPPLITYNEEETRIWREVSPKLDELHIKHAS